jgi:hypothetical protein
LLFSGLCAALLLAGCASTPPIRATASTDSPAATTESSEPATESPAATTTPAPPPSVAPTTTRPPTTPPVRPQATHRPAPRIVATTTVPSRPAPHTTTAAPVSNCDPAYPGVCLKDGIGDYDCAGGSGNGPNYVEGPIKVLPPDPFGLDRDHDGVGCE